MRRQETQKCHLIAQRMALQEHLIQNSEEIFKAIDDIVSNDEQYKLLNKENTINDYFDRWLSDFEIANPTSDFFSDPENCDEELSCNILSKLDFLFRTLEIFGLPVGYVDGGGHHANWE